MMDNGREMPTGALMLGVASLGIGFLEMASPETVEKMLGLEHKETNHGILRVLGLREIVQGVSLLTSKDASQAAAGLWARVLGDVLDTVVLSAAATKTLDAKKFAGTSAGVMGIGTMDLMCAMKAGAGG